MGAAALESVSKALIAAGRSPQTPAVSVEWGTTPQQRSVASPLEAIAAAVTHAGLATPLLTVIGEVASLRDHIAWFEKRPLFGKRVLVTRTRGQASALSELLRRSGATPVELPTLELVTAASDGEMESMTRRLMANDYLWCLFTSTNAVDFVLAYFERSGRDVRALAGCNLAALGSATAAALRRHGLRPELVASEFTSDGLLDSLRNLDMRGARVLLPRAEGGSPGLARGLMALGADVDELVLYEARPPKEIDPEALALVRAGRIDVATFASSSAVRNLASLLGPDFARLHDSVIACIGPVTAATARDLGLAVAVEPSEHTLPALVEALEAHSQLAGTGGAAP
jgi:uroporphyrinogen III methyltransferase/synthase